MLSRRFDNTSSIQSNPEHRVKSSRVHSKEIVMGVVAVGLAVVGSAALSLYNRGKRSHSSSLGGWEELDFSDTKDPQA